MQKRIWIITIILVFLVFSSTLCFENDKNPKKPPKGPWYDLTNFNQFLEQEYDVTVLTEPGTTLIKSMDNTSDSLYIIVGTDEPFTEAEAAALYFFVKSGGKLVVAADNTNVNTLSSKFGIKYSNYTILDKGYDYNYSFIPMMVNNGPIAFNIIVHSPRGLEISAANYEILGKSSEYPGTVNSALDLNDNTIMDSEDQPGPIPVIVEVRVNDGIALFISDAGLFSDNLWKLSSISDKPEYLGHVYENQEYIQNVISTLHTKDGKLIYDKSKQTANFSNFHPYPAPKE